MRTSKGVIGLERIDIHEDTINFLVNYFDYNLPVTYGAEVLEIHEIQSVISRYYKPIPRPGLVFCLEILNRNWIGTSGIDGDIGSCTANKKLASINFLLKSFKKVFTRGFHYYIIYL